MSERAVATTPITNAHTSAVAAMSGIPASGAADVIIVLGGGVGYDGTLTPVSRGRVDCALGLYRAGVAPRLIMTGKSGLLLSKPVSEAEAMAAHARSHGIPDSAILVEQRARDTYGNARFTHERFLAPNRWERVHIVTSDFHRRRAKLLFRAVLGAEYDCSYTLVSSGTSPSELALRLLEPIKLTFLPHIRLRASK